MDHDQSPEALHRGGHYARASRACRCITRAGLSVLDPQVIATAKQSLARLLEDLRRFESGEAPGITRYEVEMLRDKVRELDALLRDHDTPASN